MQGIQEFFNTEFFHNTGRQWCWLAGVILFVIIFKRYISKFISLLLFRLVNKTDAGELTQEFLHLILKPLQYLIVLQTIYFGFNAINYPFNSEDEVIKNYVLLILNGTYRFLFIIIVAWLISRLGDFFIAVLNFRALKTEDPWDDQLVVFLKEIIRMLIWIIAFLSILGAVFTVNIYSLVAGAGIAGIAIAFAAQETLQNVFGSISIFTEKPFIIGDLVEVDSVTGTVVKVGFRSTRIRTVNTEYITIPNKNIVSNRMTNLTRRTSRRLEIKLGLAYNTSQAQLEKIIKEILEYGDQHPQKNDSANVGLMGFGAIAIEVFIEFYFEFVSWGDFIKLRNEVLFQIMKIVQENDAEFAFQHAAIVTE